MIKKENKLIQITLDPESLELLNSLAYRFHISKTDMIKQAIKYFAASKNHHYIVNLSKQKEETYTNEEIKHFEELAKVKIY